MLQGFKDFLTRGNAIDLAVGVVIGAAFGAVVTALVDNVLNPLIGGIFGQPNLDRIWVITMKAGSVAADGTVVPPTEILVGAVLTALINLLLVAFAIYFCVVVPMNKLNERRNRGKEAEPEAVADDVALLTEIRDLLARQS